MKYVINDHLVLSRVPEGPLAAYLGPFAESLSRQGYTQRYIHRQVMLAACISRWLKQTEVSPRRITSEHPARYLRFRYRRRRPNQGDPAALGHFIEFLRCERVIPAEKVATRQLTPAEQCVQAYEQFLREERVLAEATIVNYAPFIDRFLKDRFGAEPVKLSSLRATDVVRFVQRQARHLHLKRAKLLTSALRSFLQYARYRGEIRLDLAAVVPCVANWSMPTIPRGDVVGQRTAGVFVQRHDAVAAALRRAHVHLACAPAHVLEREPPQLLTTQTRRREQEHHHAVAFADRIGGVDCIDHAPNLLPREMIGNPGHSPARHPRYKAHKVLV